MPKLKEQPLWSPSLVFQRNTRLYRYQKWLTRRYGLRFDTYGELWQWSVREPALFWESIWQYFEVKSYTPYGCVISRDPMPHARWFEGATLNYAEHIFLGKTDFSPALRFASENQTLTAISWENLENHVASFAAFLKQNGVRKGDRVVAYLPNIPEAIIAFLATASLGAIWSSCSPDFGTNSVVERFQLIEPKVLIAADGYQYGGKSFDKTEVVEAIAHALPSLETILFIPYLNKKSTFNFNKKNTKTWSEAIATEGVLHFDPVDFAHPLYILFSSGTTGKPKAITHCHGGILLEHLKYLAFHNNLQIGENFFWYSTTGWMMWNFAVSALLLGGTLVIYDGSPTYPDMNVLWDLVDSARINHFGTSAAFLTACMKQSFRPKAKLQTLTSIGSTGSPLPPEAFEYVYHSIKKNVWLASMSGGTDVCTAWVGGNPLLPVYAGEIQCRCLGTAMHSWDENGQPVINDIGEMVVTQPMPSMPVFFWNDPDFAAYNAAYFEMYPSVWRHGDWLKITGRGSLVIQGRSDATLNRHGIRIGTAEIYNVLNTIPDIADALIVNIERAKGEHFMPLFVVLTEGVVLNDALKQKINTALRKTYSPRHVPDAIFEVEDIPYTLSGKKMEAPVKKILMGMPIEKAVNIGAMRNPDALRFFVEFYSNRL